MESFISLKSMLEELVEAHERSRQPFSAWQCHCLREALSHLRIGRPERARRCLDQAINPPATPPPFPYPGGLTTDDLRRALSQISVLSVIAPTPEQGAAAAPQGEHRPSGGHHGLSGRPGRR